MLPQHRIDAEGGSMSGSGPSATSPDEAGMSAAGGEAVVLKTSAEVRIWPEPDTADWFAERNV